MAQNSIASASPQTNRSFSNGRLKPLNQRDIDALTKSAFVGGVPGLQYCYGQQRSSYRLYYRLPGDRQRRAMTLGAAPPLKLSEAKARANDALKRASEGEDPKDALVQHVQTAIAVDDALDEYLLFCDAENAARTVVEKRIAFRTHIRPTLAKATLRNLDSGDWLRAIDKLGRKAGARRNLYAYTRHFLSWAKDRKYISTNPLADVRPPKKLKNRKRWLNDEEIQALWAIDSLIADLARLAVLTAQRETSLGSMRWRDIDLKRRMWRIPGATMKSGEPHDVPLSTMAMEIVSKQMRMAGDYIFGVRSEGEKPYNGFSNGMDGLRKTLAGEPSLQGQRVGAAIKKARRKAAEERKATQWRFHDLRRTAVTLAQDAGQPLDDIRALTQHKIGGVMGTYAQHTYDLEKRRVVDAIERKVAEILQ